MRALLFRPSALGLLAVTALLLVTSAARGQSFENFESGHVRPLAGSPAGDFVFAVNTPDNRLAIFAADAAGLSLVAEVPVGLEPVTVGVRAIGGGLLEAWVVNHLSDSLSVVEMDPADPAAARVVRTLFCGDEPRDLVFAGSGGNRVFVTAAHRGQNRPGDPQLTTEGIGRADVWVFDADAPGTAFGGAPIAIVELFADTPRALAVSPDGSSVFAAAFHSGNGTMSLLGPVVSLQPGGRTKPADPVGSPSGAPDTGLIVRRNPSTGAWLDELGQDWGPVVPFNLPDLDVFELDANATPPVQVDAVPHAGTILFNMAVHPTNGRVYVSNTEARNHVRFEGMDPVEGAVTQGVKGHIAESRITVIDGGAATPRHVNPHIDYLAVPGSTAEVEQTLAFPTDLVFSGDGSTLYVAGFGSEKVGVFSTANLDSAAPVTKSLIEVGGGPSGLVLDEPRGRLYVMSRFTQRVSVVDLSLGAMTDAVSLRFDPSPAVVNQGRRILYDARRTSAHGESACASCHVFGDFDSLGWDLGDPTGSVATNFNPFLGPNVTGIFHPLKGPMTTQSLRGMANHGPMHWRGDRSGAAFLGDPAAFDEDLAFKAFNVAFPGLLGRSDELVDSDMQKFADFALSLRYPPNPIRSLANGPEVYWKEGIADFSAGEAFYFNTPTDAGLTCNQCHTLDPNQGFFGGDGRSTFEGETQEFKIPHLRNAYQKVGMFGFPGNPSTGDQVRGFGFLHDGGIDTLFSFVSGSAFTFPGNQAQQDAMRRELEEMMLALDTDFAPTVGQQVEVTPALSGDAAMLARVALLEAQAAAGACDLTAKGRIAGELRGAVLSAPDTWTPDRSSDPTLSTANLLALATTPGQELVLTCVPPGLGTRVGIDRDEDGALDRDELDAARDPADSLSFPGSPVPVLIQTTAMIVKGDTKAPFDPARRRMTFRAVTKDDPAPNRIVPPVLGGAADPTNTGGTLHVYNVNGTAEKTTVALPAAFWSATSTGYKFRDPDSQGPIRTVTLKDDRLIIRGGKAAFGFTADEPRQGRIVVRLVLGNGASWCAEGVARAKGTPPSTAKFDKVGKFQSERRLPAPPSCPVPPAG